MIHSVALIAGRPVALARLARVVAAAVCLAAWALPGVPRAVAADDVRLAVPFVSQFDGSAYAATNCGPASLAMVLRFLSGDRATPDQLRRTLSRLPGAGYAADPAQGTAIQDLAALGRQRGLQSILGTGPGSTGWTPDRAAEQLGQRRPVIVLTRLNALPGWAGAPPDLDHWIVLVGMSGDRFFYHDPALGAPSGASRSIARDQLARAMRLSSVPGQGAAFAGTGDAESAAPTVPAPAESATQEPVRVVIGLVRIGNGALVVGGPGRPTREPAPPVREVAFGEPATAPASANAARSRTPSGSHRFLAY